jgi:hypothetical protein
MEQSDWFSEQLKSCSPDHVIGPISKIKSQKHFLCHYNKHLIDQACSVWIGDISSHFFFALLWTNFKKYLTPIWTSCSANNLYELINLSFFFQAWSITYHSWLTFVLLLWACLIWITPFARWFCMVSSPGLVLYAQFLLLVQFVYGLRLYDAELPIQDSTGTFDYAELGLKKWKYPCLHLGAQV